MNCPLPRFLSAMLAGIIVAPCTAIAQQAYPSKPLRAILVDATAGANTDIVIRSASPELANRLGQPIIIENRVGSVGIAGMEACARSAPDGYTFCVASGTALSFNLHTQSRLPYDPERDIRPITQLYFVIEGLVASAALPASNLKELQALATSRPAGLNFGTTGPGSNVDIFRQWLGQRWKTNIVGIPYKGFSPIVTAVLSGELDFARMGVGNIVAPVKNGKLKMIAINSTARVRMFPDVPTTTEAGMDEYPVRAWWGMIAPVATPEAVVARLNAEVIKLFREPKMAEVLDSQYLELAAGSPEAFGAFLKLDRDRIGKLVTDFKIPRQ